MNKIFILLVILTLFQVVELNAQKPNDTIKNIIIENKIDAKQLNNSIEILELQNQLERAKLYRNLFIIGFISMIVVFFVLIYIYKNRIREQNKLVNIIERQVNILNQEFKKLSTIINHAENAISIADKDGNIQTVNPAYISLYGKTLEEMNENEKNLLKYNSNPKVLDQIKKCVDKKEARMYSDEFLNETGDKIWFQRNLVPILDEKNEIAALIAIDTDLTTIKMAMEQINIQKKKVEEQRNLAIERAEIIAKQKKKIDDSIVYASYIQSALLPPTELINSIIQNYFILFKPRDVVSGDFYYVNKIEQKISENKINELVVVCAADCTGHGVPGAFMSMLGVSFLNEIVNNLENDVLEINAAIILNRLRENVTKSLHQNDTGSETKDGMDIALCVIDYSQMKLNFAGANNPLYLVKKNAENEFVLEEAKPDKMPIGVYYGPKKDFTNHILNFEKDNSIYLSSDGYEDQFGGEKGRKFLSKNFKNVIVSNQSKTMNEQKIMLDEMLKNWMSFKDEDGLPFEQVDDILVFGLKL